MGMAYERGSRRERRNEQGRADQRDRDGDGDRRIAPDRVRDAAKTAQLESRWRAMERDHPEWSHAFRRHVDVTDQQLARRAATGELPGGGPGPRPANATRWRSGGTMVMAVDGLKASDEFRRKKEEFAENPKNKQEAFTVRRPLSEVLGPDWRAQVYGRTAASNGAQPTLWNAHSVAVCTWQKRSDGKWHPLTCYPEPGALRSRASRWRAVARA
jgi:hypothetical protein